jgi:hypothetical protein
VPSHREVLFEDEAQVTVLSGTLILMSMVRELQILRASELIDYPIAPNTQIEVFPSSSIRVSFDDQSELDLQATQEW